MSGRGSKAAAGAVFAAFAGFEALLLMYGEGILFGHRVYLDVLGPFILGALAASAASMLMICRNCDAGYPLLGLTIAATLVMQFGHWMLWWPCDYCVGRFPV